MKSKSYIIVVIFLFMLIYCSVAYSSDLKELQTRYQISYQKYINALNNNAGEEETQILLEICVDNFNAYKKAAEKNGLSVADIMPGSSPDLNNETDDDKIKELSKLIAGSTDMRQIENARMQLAELYINKGMNNEAEQVLMQIIVSGGALKEKASNTLTALRNNVSSSQISSLKSPSAINNETSPEKIEKNGFFSVVKDLFKGIANVFANLFSANNNQTSKINDPGRISDSNKPVESVEKPIEEVKQEAKRPENFADPIKVKVLVLNFDPVISDGNSARLHTKIGRDPHILAQQCVDDLREMSHGIADYEIAQWIDADTLVPFLKEYFKPEDGMKIDFKNEDDYFPSYNSAEEYLKVMKETEEDEKKGLGNRWASTKWHGNRASNSQVSKLRVDFHGANYKAIFKKFDVVSKINSGAIDEVWIFAPHMSGLNESKMAGPTAFFINGDPVEGVESNRNFAVMGYNYAYPVGNMLEDFGHRMEFNMCKVFSSTRTFDINKLKNANTAINIDYNSLNLWERFVAVDIILPGKAGVGTMHYAPNSLKDYEWQNTAQVCTYSPDWLLYPNFSGKNITAGCSEWIGNISTERSAFFEAEREHHKWWFRHIPHLKGKICDVDGNEYLNNWWSYMLRNSYENE